MKSQPITSNQMTPEEMFSYAWRNGFTMWAMIDGHWKHVTEVNAPENLITVEWWDRPSEIGKTRDLDISRCTEFDLTN